MDASFLLVFGGIGLFLLGMLVLTDGLRALAGSTLRRILTQFTRSPASGAVTGALTTAVIQSSSATTVTTVGFVGAGLLTFPQALGIIFGANIGTTMTGWLVAILGFKLHLGVVVLPVVLLGVLMRMFGRGRLQHIGWTLAGFSLLFIGIDAMQQGMAPFEGTVTPQDFPDDTLLGRLQLVLIGVAITLVTQSSSAGVATALVALDAGAISFPQAAAMVIGMDVGTTFTAVLATIGGSTAMRQTGYAHLVYNLLAGTLAFFLLGAYAAAVHGWLSGGDAGDAQIALVAFHTTFNTIGVTLMVTFARPFARLVVWLVPERGPPLLRRLDDRLLRDPAAAADAAAATIDDIAVEQFSILIGLLDPRSGGRVAAPRLRALDDALEATRDFVERIRTEPSQGLTHQRHIASMHALDHLNRLSHRCAQLARIETLGTEARLRRLGNVLRDALTIVIEPGDLAADEKRLNRLRHLLRRQRRSYRERTLAAASLQQIGTQTALQRLDSVRWLHRVAYHAWRIVHHLRRVREEAPAQPHPPETALEAAEDEPE